MAHPDPKRQGSEKGQRQHAGRTSAQSDAGMQSHSQGARGDGPMPAESASDEPRADAQRPTGAPKGEQRDLEGGGRIAGRGVDVSGDARARSDGQRPLPPRGGKADAER